jgi:hypothetical protein
MSVFLCLLVLTGLPEFYSVFQSQGAQKLVCSAETASGYIVIGSLQQGWGGVPGTVIYTTDQHGRVVSQTVSSFSGEPVAASVFQNGLAVVCSAADGVTSVCFFNNSGEEQWLTQFSAGGFQNAAVCSSGSDAVIAGNDSGTVRVSKLNDSGSIVWNTGYPSVDFSICDVCSHSDKIFVVGSCENPGWRSSLCVLSMDSTGGMPELHTLFSGDGRIIPVAVEADSRGLFILINAMTDTNNMIGETRLVKLGYSMEHQWTAVVAGRSWETGADLTALPGGDFAVCGWTNSISPSESNRSDLFISRFSDNGGLLWTRRHGTVSTDYGLSVSPVSDGGLIVSGCVTETLYQGWLLKTDSLGCVEVQGVQNSLPGEFSAVPLNNPSVSGFLCFAVNCVEPGTVKVAMYDMYGRAVSVFSMPVVSGRNSVNAPATVPAGVYSVRVSSGLNESVFRTVVCGGVK